MSLQNNEIAFKLVDISETLRLKVRPFPPSYALQATWEILHLLLGLDKIREIFVCQHPAKKKLLT